MRSMWGGAVSLCGLFLLCVRGWPWLSVVVLMADAWARVGEVRRLFVAVGVLRFGALSGSLSLVEEWRCLVVVAWSPLWWA